MSMRDICLEILYALLFLIGAISAADTLLYRGMEYTFADVRKGWEAAEEYCVKLEGHLLAIPDQDTQDFIKGEMQKRKWRMAWIGGEYVMGDWHWLSDDSAVTVQGCWADDSKKRDLTTKKNVKDLTPENCVKACKAFAYAAVQNGKTCYCGNEYGKHGYKSGGCRSTCPGGKDKGKCGGPNQNSVYKVKGSWIDWQEGEPNDKDISCGTINKNYGFAFTDDSCLSRRPYICQIDKPFCKSGEDGYLEIKEKCYYAERSPKDFSNARIDCMERGGDLTKIADAKERDALAKELSKMRGFDKIYVGLAHGSWMWTTGTKMMFQLQSNSQSTTAKTCLYIAAANDYKWASILCFWPYNFVCQKLGPPTTPAPSTIQTEPTTAPSTIETEATEPTTTTPLTTPTTTVTTTTTTTTTMPSAATTLPTSAPSTTQTTTAPPTDTTSKQQTIIVTITTGTYPTKPEQQPSTVPSTMSHSTPSVASTHTTPNTRLTTVSPSSNVAVSRPSTMVPTKPSTSSPTVKSPMATENPEEIRKTTLMIVALVCVTLIALTAGISAFTYLYFRFIKMRKIVPVRINEVVRWNGTRIIMDE